MYHSESANSVKETIMKSLNMQNGSIRRVFATQSLSVGVNCLEVVFWGPAKNMDDYFQECGRAGRDGLPSSAILLFSSSQLHQCPDPLNLHYKTMYKNYCIESLWFFFMPPIT